MPLNAPCCWRPRTDCKSATSRLNSPPWSPSPTDPGGTAQPLSLQEAERRAVVHALEASDWNITKAAQVLNINRVTLYRKLRKYNLLAER